MKNNMILGTLWDTLIREENDGNVLLTYFFERFFTMMRIREPVKLESTSPFMRQMFQN